MNKEALLEKKETQHDYERFPFGSWPRLIIAFRELTGIDMGCSEFLDEKNKKEVKNGSR